MPLSQRRYTIAICGAGTAGLAASAFLAEQGHDVVVFERFSEPRPVGAGLLLQPTGLACLTRLGVAQMVVDLGARIDRLYGETVDGRVVLDMGYADLSPGLFGIGIHRASLFAALKQAADARGVRIVANTEMASIERPSIGRARTSESPFLIDASGARHGPYDLVIDATGSRSVLRRTIDDGLRVRPFRYSALWCPVPMLESWPDATRLTQRYQGASIMIGVLPIGRLPGESRQLAALFWSLRADAFETWRANGLEAWKSQVRQRWPQIGGLLECITRAEDLSLATYADVTLSPSIGNGVAVIGDAAHGTSPQLGQGANLALADALFLARSLDAAPDIASGLEAYQQARRRHVQFYQRASRWLTPFFQSDSRLAGALRDWTFGPTGRIGFVRRQMVATLCGVKTGLFGRIDPTEWSAGRPHADSVIRAEKEQGPPDVSGPEKIGI